MSDQPKIAPTPNDRPTGIAQYLDPVMQSISQGADDVSLEDIKGLKDFKITESDAAKIIKQDVLAIKDDTKDRDIGHLIFRWLNPAHRSKVGMKDWRWVKGELAALVRKKKILAQIVGGGHGTSVIVNGDLMLAFMPRDLHHAKRVARRKVYSQELKSIMDPDDVRSEIGRKDEVTRDVRVEESYEGRMKEV